MRWLSMSSTRRRDDLGEPQAGGVGGHEDGAVLEAGDGRRRTGSTSSGLRTTGSFFAAVLGQAMLFDDPSLPRVTRRGTAGRRGPGCRLQEDLLLLDEVEQVGADFGPSECSGDLPKCLANRATRRRRP